MTKEELAQEFSNTSLEDAEKNREHFSPLCDDKGYPLPGNINNKETGSKVSQFCDAIAPKPPQTTPAPTPDTKPTPTPDTKPTPTPDTKPTPPPAACDKDALNMELSNEASLESALARRTHFRCLCDDKGYPLVGNINSKGATASKFCGALREKGQL